MLETMQAARGIGLAAPQVGKLLRLITIQIPENEPMIMFNPKVEKSFGRRNVEEGCLSVPGFTGIIERSVTIDASYLDQNKAKIKLTASELLSQAIEHEIDHLNGIVYLDHLKSHEDLHKSGITPNDIHWHDVGYKIFINKWYSILFVIYFVVLNFGTFIGNIYPQLVIIPFLSIIFFEKKLISKNEY